MTVATDLASFAVATAPGEIPASVRARAALHLLDAIGCGVAAVGTGAGRHATTVAETQGGEPRSSLLGSAKRIAPAPAALANGTRCHSLDFDDTHELGICHSSAVVAPAALAVGEVEGASGAEVLDAYILGSEVALRIAVGTADGLYARGFHPTSVCGVFGAAAAASRLLGRDATVTTNALGIAGSFAGGLFEYLSDGSATKPLHAGWAAQGGILAAELAAAGGTGPGSVVEGRFGLIASHTDAAPDASEIAGELGERWEVAQLSIKPYPACHFAHASTWAAGDLFADRDLSVEDIEDVVVGVPAEGVPLVIEPAADKVAPRTPYDAKFSLPYMVAHRLVRGHLDLDSFATERIGDPEILAVARRVRGVTLKDPPSRFAGSAAIRSASGQTFEAMLEHAPGSPANPLDERWILAKFRANTALGLPTEKADTLMELLRTLDELDSLELVGELLRDASEGRDR
jgi:2-methylcitrate dehydratase PrpD